MLIGVLADSHDNLPMIVAAVKRLESEGAEVLIHAGDFVAPFAVRALLKFPHRVIGVFGNNDGERQGIEAIWPEVCVPPRRLRLGEKNIIVIHDRAKLRATDLLEADILIYGHTHRPDIQVEGRLLCVNPGECGGWLTDKSTVAVIDTDTMAAHIMALEPRRS